MAANDHRDVENVIDRSRNERQKTVLLVEVARKVGATSIGLVQQTKQALADSKKVQEEITAESSRISRKKTSA